MRVGGRRLLRHAGGGGRPPLRRCRRGPDPRERGGAPARQRGAHQYQPVGGRSSSKGSRSRSAAARGPVGSRLRHRAPLGTHRCRTGPVFVGRTGSGAAPRGVGASVGRGRWVALSRRAGSRQDPTRRPSWPAAPRRRRRVLSGRCDEELGVPYQPFVEASGSSSTTPPTSCRRRGAGGDLARLVPRWRTGRASPPPPQADAETERCRMFEAVAACGAAPAPTPFSSSSTTSSGRRADAAAGPSRRPCGPTNAAPDRRAPIATPTSTAAIRWPRCSPICGASRQSNGCRCGLRRGGGGRVRRGGRPGTTTWTRTASRWPERCTPRPRATRSSCGRSCGT